MERIQSTHTSAEILHTHPHHTEFEPCRITSNLNNCAQELEAAELFLGEQRMKQMRDISKLGIKNGTKSQAFKDQNSNPGLDMHIPEMHV